MSQPPPPTRFDWLQYADATFAGLATLIPLPLVDSLIESYFRRRMVWNIAKRRQVRLPDPIYQHMTREGCNWGAVLLWPITLVWKFLKKLSRKILYFLTVKEATDKLSYYWHRAYLLDYMIVQGHLEQEETAVLARTALEQVLDTITTSPLTKLAQQVANNTRHVWRTLRRVRWRNQEDETIAASKAMMDEQWEESATYLATIAQQYELLYEQQVAERTRDEVRSTNGEGQMTTDQ